MIATTVPVGSTRPLSRAERVTIALEVLLSVGALIGGALLILGPDGRLLGMPLDLLAGSPFPSYLVPGLILFTCLGVAPLFAAASTIGRLAIAPLLTVAIGVAVIGWIAVEMVFLAGPGSLAWSLYLVLGCAIAALGAARWRAAS